MASPKCDPKFLEKFRRKAKKENYDPDRLNEVERRVRKLAKNAEYMKGRYVDEVKTRIAKERATNDHLFSQSLGEVFNLKGSNYKALDDWIANGFGVRLGEVLGLKRNATESVRKNLLDAQRIASGLIDETARYVGMRNVKAHSKNIENLFRKYGIRDPRLKAEIRMDSIEIGTYPNQKASFNIGEAGNAYLQGKYNQFVEQLENLGFSPEDIDSLTESSHKISSSMNDVRIMANSLGLNIGKIDGIGYFTRTFVPEVSRMIDAAKRQGKVFGDLLDKGQGFSLSTNIQNSRKTFKLIPEDLTVLSELTETPLEAIKEVIDNGNMTKWLHNKVSAATLEELIDTGILSKVPMTSREVADYIVSQFKDLPYKGMDDIFVTEPEKVFDFYVNNLQDSVRKSAQARTMIREGLQQGWVVDKAMKNADPELFSKFEKISADDIRQYFPQYRVLDSLYVHPIVSNTWKATLKASGDPRFMNALSQHVNYWGSLFSNAMLIHPAYASRVITDSARAVISSGANFSRSFEGLFDITKLWNSGFDNFDSVTKRYTGLNGEKVTELELLKQFIRHRGGSLVPGVSNMRIGNVKQALKDMVDIKQMNRAVNYTYEYFKNYGAKEGLGYIADGIKGKQSDLFAPIAAIANFFEVGMKWAAIKSLADDSDQIGAFFLGGLDKKPEFNNLREIFTHIDDYFLAWDDVGTATAFASNFQPFAAFSMANPPAQVRQAMRRPREFMNYYRIKSFVMNSSDAGDEDLNEATVPHWMLQSSPIAFKKIDEDKYAALLSESFDSRASAFTFIHEGSEALARDMGWWIGTSTEQREKIENELNGRSSLVRMFSEQMARSHFLWQNATELATGVDIRTGIPIERKPLLARDSFLGFSMPSVARYALSSYPLLSRLDRWNPNGILGEPEITDPRTGEIINPAKLSFTGARRTHDRNRIEKYAAGQMGDKIAMAAWLGADLRIIDVARNLQWTTKEVGDLRNALESSLSQARRDLVEEELKGVEDSEYLRRKEVFNDQVEKLIFMEFEYQKLIKYMSDKNITPKNFFEDIEKEAVRQYIQQGGQSEIDDVLIKSIEKYQKLFIGDNNAEQN